MKRKNWIALAVTLGLTLVGGTALSQAGLAITAGGPPVTASVPAAPSMSLVIATPSEVQIDATATDGDAQLVLSQNGSTITEDQDGGDGVNARIITFLAPGTYDVSVWEWRGGAMTASVAAMVLPPLTPAATIAPGAPPAVVNAPAGDSMRSSSAEVAITIATAGNYTIDAVGPAGGGCDSQLVVIRDNAEVGRDSDSGDENNARWTGALTPGTYGVRVYDWINRACTINVTVAPAP